MALTIIRGATSKQAASNALIQVLGQSDVLSGELYIGYPILGSADGRMPIDALLVSPDKGLILFDLIEGNESAGYDVRQDDAANMLESKLRSHKELVDKRILRVPIHTVSFGPALPQSKLQSGGDYPVTSATSILEVIKECTWIPDDLMLYPQIRSALQNISTIRQGRTKRIVQKANSRGAKLKFLEDAIATLDSMQSRAVIETVEGVQRIRGLAGSGKTIVLALKAAYLHAQHPEWRIAVTFNTRSLKAQFRRFINTFCVAQTNEEPDWNQIRVINAWGAPGGPARDGLYYEFCMAHKLAYYDFGSAKDAFGQANAFKDACGRALEAVKDPQPLYDAILIDEAQDFPDEFLRLCYEMLTENKHLVYAYDELQNLSGESMKPPEAIFGNGPDGKPKVRLDDPSPNGARRDIILEVCYRNSKPVLTTAHALGFGVYRRNLRGEPGLVQMFDQPYLWQDIGYNLKDGDLSPGTSVTLERTSRSSPPFLEQHSPIEDLISFLRFKDNDDQVAWLVKEIHRNLTEDELKPEDIVVINPDPLSTRNLTGPIRAKLLEMDIKSHLAGVTTDPDVFFMPEAGSITFTGVFRAKGNEAGMVYIINAHDCYSGWNLASIRNRLFTAITRSKAWVRVLGVGTKMQQLTDEFGRIVQHDFQLQFVYPTEEERKSLAILHRDMAPKSVKSIQSWESSAKQLLAEIQAGRVHPEDLDPTVVHEFRRILEANEEL